MQVFRWRGDVCALLWSAAFAAWCLLWPMAIVATTLSMPGFMTLRGRGGLAEVVEMLVPLPWWATALATGMLAFALMWVLLQLYRRCDRDGDAIMAVRWSLSSRRLNALVLIALAAVPVTMFGSLDDVAAWLGDIDPGLSRFFLQWWWLGLLAIVAVLELSLPFCLLNPHTLSRSRFERWWRPFWPGVLAVVVGIAVGLATQVSGIVYDGDRIVGMGGWRWPLIVVQDIALGAAQLAALALWLNRGTWRTSGAALSRAFRFDVLRRWVALELFWLAMTAVVAVPVLSLTVFDVYLSPQFVEWERSGAVEIPPVLRALILTTDGGILHEGLLAAMSHALGLYGLVSAGRLLVGLGFGRSPAGGSARAAGT